MQIKNENYVPSVDFADPFSKGRQDDTSFASMLEAERLKAETERVRNDILAGQTRPDTDKNKEDFAFIREHGFRAYAEDIHKQKIEELREKLLSAMGLTEVSLAELPADQRLAIEKMIAQEIQKRMAADSMSNGGEDSAGAPGAKAPIGEAGKDNLLAAQVVAGETGAVIGQVIREVTEGTDTNEQRLPGDENR